MIAILAIAIVRFWVNFTRRYATARVGVRLKGPPAGAALRRLPALPAGVLPVPPTGQVVSRATNDLFPIRYFIGWGVVQGFQSAMMITGWSDHHGAGEPAADALLGRRHTADPRSSPGASPTS